MVTKVNVGNDMLPDPIGKIFAPFCAPDETILWYSIRADSEKGIHQAYLFTVPTGDQDGTEWSPALLV